MPAPEVIGEKYRVLRELGRGGMGVVYAARHIELGHDVAVKLLSGRGAFGTVSTGRFLREARAAANVRDPHVVQVVDVGTMSDGAPYLVMELLAGDDLAKTLRAHGPLAISEAANYVLQACEGMSAVHALGIVHRDLKPANLFLTRVASGEALVKVVDFGIAKVATAEHETKTGSHEVLGTPQHMSPEQLKSSAAVDARTDVWSLGVTLFQLLTGRLPFDGVNITITIAKILTEPPRSLRGLRPEVPPELEAIVLRCLEKDVHLRIQDVGTLAVALAPFAGVSRRGGEGVPAPIVALGVRPQEVLASRAGRARWATAGLGATMFGLGILASALTAPHHPDVTTLASTPPSAPLAITPEPVAAPVAPPVAPPVAIEAPAGSAAVEARAAAAPSADGPRPRSSGHASKGGAGASARLPAAGKAPAERATLAPTPSTDPLEGRR